MNVTDCVKTIFPRPVFLIWAELAHFISKYGEDRPITVIFTPSMA